MIAVRHLTSSLRSRSSSGPHAAFLVSRCRMMSSAASAPDDSAVRDFLRPSASLILVNKHNEALLVERNPQARSFAGTYVFPGGNFDAKQDASLSMTAIRETFEETGILIASPTSPNTQVLNGSTMMEARTAIHEQKLDFQTFLCTHDWTPAVTSLLPFTTWITPLDVSRRFRTQFYILFLEDFVSSVPLAKDGIYRLPTPDSGQEIITTRFIHPGNAIAKFENGQIRLFPPQHYILDTLRQLLPGDVNTPEQRQAILRLSQRSFGRLIMHPHIHRDSKSGEVMFIYEGDELLGGPAGRHHRAIIQRKDGLFSDIRLQRNFDILTDEITGSSSEINNKL